MKMNVDKLKLVQYFRRHLGESYKPPTRPHMKRFAEQIINIEHRLSEQDPDHDIFVVPYDNNVFCEGVDKWVDDNNKLLDDKHKVDRIHYTKSSADFSELQNGDAYHRITIGHVYEKGYVFVAKKELEESDTDSVAVKSEKWYKRSEVRRAIGLWMTCFSAHALNIPYYISQIY